MSGVIKSALIGVKNFFPNFLGQYFQDMVIGHEPVNKKGFNWFQYLAGELTFLSIVLGETDEFSADSSIPRGINRSDRVNVTQLKREGTYCRQSSALC